MEVEIDNFYIEPAGELDKLSEAEKVAVSDLLMNFLGRHRNRFGEAHLHMVIKEHKEQFREKPKMYCSINLTTDRGRFNSSEHGWGAEQAVHNCLRQLDTQIEKKFGKMETRVSVRKNAVEEIA